MHSPWTEIGETLGELQDKTAGFVHDSVELTNQWWDNEGEECFDRIKKEVSESFKSTSSYMKKSTSELNKGYIEYWEKNGTPEKDRPVFDDKFFDGFLDWWDGAGKIYFDFVIDGYRHFVENFEEYKEDYYK